MLPVNTSVTVDTRSTIKEISFFPLITVHTHTTSQKFGRKMWESMWKKTLCYVLYLLYESHQMIV